MRVLLMLATLLVPLLVLAPGASADTCSHSPERALHGQDHDYYVGWDRATLTVYVYEESNGVADLHRGGSSRIPTDADPCSDAGDEGPDTLIF